MQSGSAVEGVTVLPGREEKTFWTAVTREGGNTWTGSRLDRIGGRQEVFGNSDP